MNKIPIEKLQDAQTFLTSGEEKRAYALTHEVTISNPTFAMAWTIQATALLQLKRSSEAVEGFKKAISLTLKPQASDWHNLARAYEDNLRLDKAEEAY